MHTPLASEKRTGPSSDTATNYPVEEVALVLRGVRETRRSGSLEADVVEVDVAVTT